MKVTNVYFLQDGSKNRLSRFETKKVIDILESSSKFEQLIFAIRKSFEIPKDGYPMQQHENHNSTPHWESLIKDERLDNFNLECEKIIEEFHLPYYWTETMPWLIVFNLVITPERQRIEVYPPEEQVELGFRDMYMYIKEQMTRAEFDKEITRLWPKIEEYMQLLPKAPKHKMLRVDLAKKIVNLRDNEKLHFKHIAEKIWKEVAESEEADLINEDYVKNLYHRWKRKTDKGIT